MARNDNEWTVTTNRKLEVRNDHRENRRAKGLIISTCLEKSAYYEGSSSAALLPSMCMFRECG